MNQVKDFLALMLNESPRRSQIVTRKPVKAWKDLKKAFTHFCEGVEFPVSVSIQKDPVTGAGGIAWRLDVGKPGEFYYLTITTFDDAIKMRLRAPEVHYIVDGSLSQHDIDTINKVLNPPTNYSASTLVRPEEKNNS